MEGGLKLKAILVGELLPGLIVRVRIPISSASHTAIGNFTNTAETDGGTKLLLFPGNYLNNRPYVRRELTILFIIISYCGLMVFDVYSICIFFS